MAAVDVQIITYAPTVFCHCQHCELTFSEVGLGDQVHREQAREALPEDLRREYAELSDEIHDVMVRCGNNVRVRVIDAASIEGVFKSLKYRTHRYPAIVVDGRREDNVGSLTEKLERAFIQARRSSERHRWAVGFEEAGMNSLWVVVIGAVIIYIAYTFYAKRIDRTIIQPDPERPTPDGVIVNMVIDEKDSTTAPEFVRNRIEMQGGYLQEIGKEFDGNVRAVLPLYDSEIRGVDSLKRAGDALFD